MQRADKKKTVRDIVKETRGRGQKIALIPTMGYLHEGHLSLINEAKKKGAYAIVSIFVNPLQFGPQEDFARYPRDLERDALLAERAGADLLFHPAVDEMYPEKSHFSIQVGETAQILCGASRPGHFNGVAMVVSKLFNIVLPDQAYFGLKDYQQYIIIKQLVKDLDFPVEIVGIETKREKDGLAMSSRNVFLNQEERTEATVLPRSLFQAKEMIEGGERNRKVVEDSIKEKIGLTQGVIDYVQVRKADDLADTDSISGPVVIALAVRFGNTRLIDNIVVEG